MMLVIKQSHILQKNEAEIAFMMSIQKEELNIRKEWFVKQIDARKSRKEGKKALRNMMRQTKDKDRSLMIQEEASRVAQRLHNILEMKRKAFDSLMQHTIDLHQKQSKHQYAA